MDRVAAAWQEVDDGAGVQLDVGGVPSPLASAGPDEPYGVGEAAECEGDRGEQQPSAEVGMLALPAGSTQARAALPNDAGEVHGEQQPAGQGGHAQVVQWRDARRVQPD